jgi:hypothetical protein
VSRCVRGSVSDQGRWRPWTARFPVLILAIAAGVSAEPRSFLYHEINVASTYDDDGISLHRDMPRTSVGFEYFQKYDAGPPGRLTADALDLYAQLAHSPGRRLQARVEEVWLRFADPGADTEVRLGRFPVPFGLSPTLNLRGDPLLPLLELDLGALHEWGVAVESHARGFVYEAATTWPLLSTGRRPGRRVLVSGRVGVPTFRDVRYSLSGLYGTVATPGAGHVSAWRLATDAVYLYHEPFTALRGEASFGADGQRTVWGLLAGLSQILPDQPRWQLLAQARRWRSAVPGDGALTEVTAGFGRALPYLMILRCLWQERSPGGRRLLVQLHYYAP